MCLSDHCFCFFCCTSADHAFFPRQSLLLFPPKPGWVSQQAKKGPDCWGIAYLARFLHSGLVHYFPAWATKRERKGCSLKASSPLLPFTMWPSSSLAALLLGCFSRRASEPSTFTGRGGPLKAGAGPRKARARPLSRFSWARRPPCERASSFFFLVWAPERRNLLIRGPTPHSRSHSLLRNDTLPSTREEFCSREEQVWPIERERERSKRAFFSENFLLPPFMCMNM